MNTLSTLEVLELHRMAIERFGGDPGMRDDGLLESAVGQPRMSFGGELLYPTIEEQAAAIGFSLIMNHPFLDGNKRVGYLAMEGTLVINGYELQADVDDAERMTLAIAAGEAEREDLVEWVRQHMVKISDG